MSKSDRLRLRDVCAVLRLLGETRELGREPRAWRMHMLEGLRQLTGAQVALHMHLHQAGAISGATEPISEALDAGFLDAAQRTLWATYQRERAQCDDPFHLRYFSGFTGALRTRSLDAVIDGREWRRSRHYNDFVRACKLEDRITSAFGLGSTAPSAAQVVVLHRAAADGPYPVRALQLVRFFQRELRPLVGRTLALVSAAAELEALPSALRRVLGCMLEGDAEKQIAARLHLSPHTVNRHVQRLHRRFDVHSRAELMCRFRDVPSSSLSAEVSD